MLILTRKQNESVVVGNSIRITVVLDAAHPGN